MGRYKPSQQEIEVFQKLQTKYSSDIEEIKGWCENCFEYNFSMHPIAQIATPTGLRTVYNSFEILHCMPADNGFRFEPTFLYYFQLNDGKWYTNNMDSTSKDTIIQQLIDFRLDEESALNPIEHKIIDVIDIAQFMQFYSEILRKFSNVKHVAFDMLHFENSSQNIINEQFGIDKPLEGKIIPMNHKAAAWIADNLDFSSIHHPIKCMWLQVTFNDGIRFTMSSAGPSILHVTKSYEDDDTLLTENIYPIKVVNSILEKPWGMQKIFPMVEYSLPMIEHQSNLNVKDTGTYLNTIKKIERRYKIKFDFTERAVTPLAFLTSLDSTTPLSKEYAELSAFSWNDSVSKITIFLNGFQEPTLHIKIKESESPVIYKSFDVEDVKSWESELDSFFKLKFSKGDCGK